MFRRSSITAAALAVAASLTVSPHTAAAADPTLPDLGMARLADLVVAITPDGHTLLRFSATIVNVGAGPFELAASRPSQDSSWTVSQRVFSADRSSTYNGVPVDLVYGGDGHNHWHVKDLEDYRLDRLDNGVKVGTGAKGGFCFYDTTEYNLGLPGAPQQRVYDHIGCGLENALNVTMGLSVGWGDRYSWLLPDQHIDITGLANGKYRLHATADPRGLFAEGDYTNNATWVDLSLSTKRGRTTVTVLGYGPTADGPASGGGNGNGNGGGHGNGHGPR